MGEKGTHVMWRQLKASKNEYFLLELNNSIVTVMQEALSIQPQYHGHAFNLHNKHFYN